MEAMLFGLKTFWRLELNNDWLEKNDFHRIITEEKTKGKTVEFLLSWEALERAIIFQN